MYNLFQNENFENYFQLNNLFSDMSINYLLNSPDEGTLFILNNKNIKIILGFININSNKEKIYNFSINDLNINTILCVMQLDSGYYSYTIKIKNNQLIIPSGNMPLGKYLAFSFFN